MVDLARAMLRGETGILAGARRMLAHRSGAGLDDLDADLLAFVAIDSQEDHLPVDPNERARWDAGALARKDVEIAEAEAFHRPRRLPIPPPPLPPRTRSRRPIRSGRERRLLSITTRGLTLTHGNA